MPGAGGNQIPGEVGVLIQWINAGVLLHKLIVKFKQELLVGRFVIGNQVHMGVTVNHYVLMALKIMPLVVAQFLVVIGKRKVVGVKNQEWLPVLILLI